MKYFISESATFAPVCVSDLKAHLFLFDDDSYDAELQYILLSAQDIVTDLLGEHISSTMIQCNLNTFEDTSLPHHNLIALDSVQTIGQHTHDSVLAIQHVHSQHFIISASISSRDGACCDGLVAGADK